MSIILGIDACEFSLGLAIIQNQDKVFERISDNFDIAENIISEIDLLIRSAGCSKKDISLISVAAGPGSFTGVRSSIAATLGLSKGLNIPAVGVPTLISRFYANCGELENGNYIVIMTANKTELFCLPVSLSRTVSYTELKPDRQNEHGLVVRNIFEPFCCPIGTKVKEAMSYSTKVSSRDGQTTVFVDYFNVDKNVIKVSPALSVAITSRALVESGENCGELKPVYMRAVNAKTLAERGLEKDI